MRPRGCAPAWPSAWRGPWSILPRWLVLDVSLGCESLTREGESSESIGESARSPYLWAAAPLQYLAGGRARSEQRVARRMRAHSRRALLLQHSSCVSGLRCVMRVIPTVDPRVPGVVGERACGST